MSEAEPVIPHKSRREITFAYLQRAVEFWTGLQAEITYLNELPENPELRLVNIRKEVMACFDDLLDELSGINFAARSIEGMDK